MSATNIDGTFLVSLGWFGNRGWCCAGLVAKPVFLFYFFCYFYFFSCLFFDVCLFGVVVCGVVGCLFEFLGLFLGKL